MKIFIVGSGKLANAILSAQLTIKGCEIIHWNSEYLSLNEKAIFVHAGSGRQLQECFDFCNKTNSTLIELSTGLDTDKVDPDFPLVICPNTSILVLKTMNMLKAFGNLFKGYEISITESHQSAKTTEAGTAYDFANSLNFPADQIKSVRDPKVQENEIGIPDEFLSKHAYHRIVIKDDQDEITVETKVLGHNSYAKGVQVILETVLNTKLENKRYSVLDLV